MKPKIYNRHNFHKHTFCVFKEVDNKQIENLVPNYTSKSGSSYYFTDDGLYRVSNHWGRAANCRWKLDSSSMASSKCNTNKIGFANWTDFYPNNEQENLFYIQVDYETNTVDFSHKDNPNYDGKSICRNASETAKRIKICKEVLLEEKWANYLQFDSIDKIRKEVIHELLFTNAPFLIIKKHYLE